VAWDIQIKQDNNTVKIWKFFAAEIVSVTQDEIDLEKMKISWKSPMAKALLGKKTGDEVEVQKPHGKEFVQIREVLWG
jgi:transcription elongation GreA/GreB family factor